MIVAVSKVLVIWKASLPWSFCTYWIQ